VKRLDLGKTMRPTQRAPDTFASAQCRLVGVGAFSGSFRGFELVPAKQRYLVPPGCRACRDTPAGNASRWVAPCVKRYK
jgi:hypothetical protein